MSGKLLGFQDANSGGTVISVTATTPIGSSGGASPNITYAPGEYDAGDSSTAITINWVNGINQRVKWTGNCTVTLSNPTTGYIYTLKCVNDGTVRTITWPVTVLWPSGVAPTFTGTNLKVDLVQLYWDGTSYFGSFSGNY